MIQTIFDNLDNDDDWFFMRFPAPQTFCVFVTYEFALSFFWLGLIFTVTVAVGINSNGAYTGADTNTSAMEDGRGGDDPESKGTILVPLSPGDNFLPRFPNVGVLLTLLILSTITSVVGVLDMVTLFLWESLILSGRPDGCVQVCDAFQHAQTGC
tara:strand:- start:166 stop:630 length:465 start_codon:yes stop_codon:yes gene_type:complete